MTCRDFVEFILSYLEGEASPEQRATFQDHVAMCPPCLDYLDNYRKTIELERELCPDPEGPVPDEVPEELVRAVLEARGAGTGS